MSQWSSITPGPSRIFRATGSVRKKNETRPTQLNLYLLLVACVVSEPVADLSLFFHFFSFLQSAGQDAVGRGGAPRAFAAGEFAHDYRSKEDVTKESRSKATLPCGGAPRTFVRQATLTL